MRQRTDVVEETTSVDGEINRKIRRKARMEILRQYENFHPAHGLIDQDLFAGLTNAFPREKEVVDRYLRMKNGKFVSRLFGAPTVGGRK